VVNISNTKYPKTADYEKLIDKPLDLKEYNKKEKSSKDIATLLERT